MVAKIVQALRVAPLTQELSLDPADGLALTTALHIIGLDILLKILKPTKV